MTKKRVLEGKVYDPVLDCCHRIVLDSKHEWDILHDALSEFEDKRVRITIEDLDILEEKVNG